MNKDEINMDERIAELEAFITFKKKPVSSPSKELKFSAGGGFAVEGAAGAELGVEGAAGGELVVEGAAGGELVVEGAAGGELVVEGAAGGELVVEGAAGGGYSGAPKTIATGQSPVVPPPALYEDVRISKSSARLREKKSKIRIGPDYQADCPSFIPESERKPEDLDEPAWIVWAPSEKIPDKSLDEYIAIAKKQYGYSPEQAMGILFWHKHDLGGALNDLSKITPFHDEWTEGGKALFQEALNFHGKNFEKIKELFPDKSVGSLVQYYYSMKKESSCKSFIDQNEKSISENDRKAPLPSLFANNLPKNLITRITNADYDFSSFNTNIIRSCLKCGIVCSHNHCEPYGNLCSKCRPVGKKSGNRNTSAPPVGKFSGQRNAERQKAEPPRGVVHDHENDVSISKIKGVGNELNDVSTDLTKLLSDIQINKNIISELKQKNAAKYDWTRFIPTSNRVNSYWSVVEEGLFVRCLQTHGTDFKTISGIIGTKSTASVRSFFTNNYRRLNLGEVLKIYKAESGAAAADTSATDNVNADINGDEDNSTIITGAGYVDKNTNDILKIDKERSVTSTDQNIKKNRDINKKFDNPITIEGYAKEIGCIGEESGDIIVDTGDIDEKSDDIIIDENSNECGINDDEFDRIIEIDDNDRDIGGTDEESHDVSIIDGNKKEIGDIGEEYNNLAIEDGDPIEFVDIYTEAYCSTTRNVGRINEQIDHDEIVESTNEVEGSNTMPIGDNERDIGGTNEESHDVSIIDGNKQEIGDIGEEYNNLAIEDGDPIEFVDIYTEAYCSTTRNVGRINEQIDHDEIVESTNEVEGSNTMPIGDNERDIGGTNEESHDVSIIDGNKQEIGDIGEEYNNLAIDDDDPIEFVDIYTEAYGSTTRNVGRINEQIDHDEIGESTNEVEGSNTMAIGDEYNTMETDENTVEIGGIVEEYNSMEFDENSMVIESLDEEYDTEEIDDDHIEFIGSYQLSDDTWSTE